MPSNLNEYLQPVGAPASGNMGTPAWQFGIQQRIQTNQMRLSQINLKNFVILSGAAAASGAIGNGTTLSLQTTLTNNVPHQNDKTFAIPYVALYQGTVEVGSAQIWPRLGSGITAGAYTVTGGLDYQTTDGVNSVWSGYITDNSAGNQTVMLSTQWRCIQYNNTTTT